jgi:hypothetical protein
MCQAVARQHERMNHAPAINGASSQHASLAVPCRRLLRLPRNEAAELLQGGGSTVASYCALHG